MTKLSLYSIRTMLLAASIAVAFLIIPAQAQQSSQPGLKGAYVFSEEGLNPSGQPAATLAKFTFSETGTFVGTAIMLSGNGTVTFDAQGTYTIGTNNTGTMIMSASTTDSDGVTLGTTANYRLILRGSGEVSLVRTDPWHYTSGELVPATASVANGAYFLTESANRPIARVAMVTFDGVGNVGGFEIAKVLGVSSELKLSGTVTAQANGFQALALSAETTDESGEAQVTKENYVFLTTQKDIRMLRTDGGGSGVLTLTR